MNGFPATGYGTWRQYRRRVREKGRRAEVLWGAQCPTCAVAGVPLCGDCLRLSYAWAELHDKGPVARMRTIAPDAARMVAAR